jgi:hypothetical protein
MVSKGVCARGFNVNLHNRQNLEFLSGRQNDERFIISIVFKHDAVYRKSLPALLSDIFGNYSYLNYSASDLLNG